MKNSCIFCREARDPRTALSFLGADWPFEDRLLVESPRIFAIPGYGPQIFPYILLITRRHIISFSELEPDERAELLEIISVVAERLGLVALAVFEHAGCRDFYSCIEHFHLHLVPPVFDLRRSMLELDYVDLVIRKEEGVDVDGAYLLAGWWRRSTDAIEARIARVASKQDQFFRKEMAGLLKQTKWDWRLGMNEEWMRILTAIFKRS